MVGLWWVYGGSTLSLWCVFVTVITNFKLIPIKVITRKEWQLYTNQSHYQKGVANLHQSEPLPERRSQFTPIRAITRKAWPIYTNQSHDQKGLLLRLTPRHHVLLFHCSTLDLEEQRMCCVSS
jgi:hypothetical protein